MVRLLLAALPLLALPAHAGFARHTGVRWTPPGSQPPKANASRPAGSGSLADASDLWGQPPPPEPYKYPFAEDYRDPNSAWSSWDRFAFLLVYVGFWSGFTLTVHCWPELSARVTSLRASRGTVASRNTTNLPGAMPLLEVEHKEVNVGPTPPYPSDRSVIDLFEDRVKAKPYAVALVVPATISRPMQEVTYGGLAAAMNELAKSLLSLGVGCGSVAALVLDRSAAQVVAVFGVLKSGAAFLPIDSEAPGARKQFLVVESEAAVIVGARGDDAAAALASEVGVPFIGLPTDGSLDNLVIMPPRSRPGEEGACQTCGTGLCKRTVATPDDIAMLIYTSGTTGQPKGILYDHRFMLHGVWFFATQCEVDENSVMLLKSPYFWAIVEWELFPVLIHGGKLVVTSPTGHKSPEYLANTINTEQVSVLMITPQVLDLVLDIQEAQRAARPLRSVKQIVTVGEPLNVSLANRAVAMRGMEASVHNFYGASESSCAVYTVPREGINVSIFPNKVPVGLPQEHVKVYVMKPEDEDEAAAAQAAGLGFHRRKLSPLPTGEAGEICFGGIMAVRYWKHDDLSAQKWVETEEYGRLYLTGDLGRWRAGVLEIIGRTDRQVKVRGVRVEPEEVEAVLKKFVVPVEATASATDFDKEAAAELGAASMRPALKEVSVVASKEPAELVAFSSLRDGVTNVTTDALKAHCQANLTPAYVPKFFIILPELPKLPNGKPNLGQMRELATQHAAEEGEVVMDSLGQMKKLSRWAVFENEVIHRCYAYWMIGVLTDHYTRCALDTDSDAVFYGFCTTLARQNVKPWTELLIRSLGNDQDMFGFIMLGAYQDSRPATAGGKPAVNLGLKDAFVLLIYLAMAMPIAQMLRFLFGNWGWPSYWGGYPAPENVWGWDFMRVNSYTSDHRWYLGMVLRARVMMEIAERLKVPSWVQCLLVAIPPCLPESLFEGKEYAFDVCQGNNQATYVMYTFSWMFRNFGDGCAMYWRWNQWYVMFYVWCFHFLRPIVSRVDKVIPKGRTWAAASLSASMTIGLLMGMFHYPNDVLENGTGFEWAWLEVGVDIVQPTLFILGMTYVPFNLVWWGNTTLGSYVFHFYFKDQVAHWIWSLCDLLAWDATGMLLFLAIVAVSLIFTTFIGPIGHFFLLTPAFLSTRIARLQRAREARIRAQTAPAACDPGASP